MNADERAVVLGPLAVPAVVLIAVGTWRRRRAATFAGGLLLGLAIKVVTRPQPSEPAAG